MAPERSAERDAAIVALLPHVPFDGWTRRALRAGLSDIDVDPEEAEQLFPGGAADMIETFCDWADRRMEEDAATLDRSMRLHERVRAAGGSDEDAVRELRSGLFNDGFFADLRCRRALDSPIDLDLDARTRLRIMRAHGAVQLDWRVGRGDGGHHAV